MTHQSFTAGAAALGLTRATISAQVSELERWLGLTLLHRSTRAIRLTSAGQAFRLRLADLPERVDAAERAARAEQTAPEGRLRITAPPDLAQRFLIGWMAEFLAAHPAITIEMELSNAAHNLIEQRFDLAIRGLDRRRTEPGHPAVGRVAAVDLCPAGLSGAQGHARDAGGSGRP